MIKQLIGVFLVFGSVPDWYKTQEVCGRVASEYPCLIAYCLDKYKIQRMCDEAVDDSLAVWKLILDGFVTNQMIKKLYTAFYAEKNILCFDEDSDNVIFSCNEMGIVNIDLKNINLDNNFDEDDSDIAILVFTK